MFGLRLITSCVVIVILFRTTTSQHCPHHSPDYGFAPVPMDSECLCKDLASAIQSVVLAKLKRSSHGPTLGQALGQVGQQTNFPNTAPEAQRVCPISAGNWRNSLARVLGMSNLGPQNNIPVSNTPVNIPYSTIVSHSGSQGYETPVQNYNTYSVIEMGAPLNNAGNLGVNNLGVNVANTITSNNAAANVIATNMMANNVGANMIAANVMANNGGANAIGAVGANSVNANSMRANTLNAILSRSIPNAGNSYPEVVFVGNANTNAQNGNGYMNSGY